VKWLGECSGIGGMELGLQRAGHEIIGLCEKEKWHRKILRQHFPNQPIFGDVKHLNNCFARLRGLPQDFRVRIFQTQEQSTATAPELPEPVQDSSGRLCTPFAWLDQKEGCWKTWQTSFVQDGGWERFSGRWPKSGMTRNGIAYRRPALAHLTNGKGSVLIPTIGANESKGCQKSRYRGSKHFRGAKMSEGLRTCPSDPIYTHPNFAEAVMGFPKDWTLLETRLCPKSLNRLGGQ